MDPIEAAVAKALCHTSATERTGSCSFCKETGKCEMWSTFVKEARAAIAVIAAHDKISKALVGLGG